MEIIWTIYFFIIGIVFGSFFNVVGLRTKKEKLFEQKRSFCPHCRHTLSARELVPIFSYLFQKGKCRHCKKRISPLYPTMEFVTGCLFAYSYMHLGFQVELLTALLMVSMFMILMVTDLKYMLIPNRVLLFFLPLFVVLRIIQPLDSWWSPWVGGFIGFSIIALIILLSKGGMGAGDMKLFGVIGIILGFPNVLLAFFFANLVGLLYSIPLIIGSKKGWKKAVPFGPAIIIGSLITYFFGEGLLAWYFELF